MAINLGFEKYVRWSVKRKALLWAGFAVVVLGLYTFLWLMPKRAEIKSLDQESSKLAGQIIEKKAIADNLDSVKSAVVQMDKLLTQALEKLPSGEEIPKLLKTISDIARDSGLESMLFRPGVAKPVEPEFFYASITLDMEQRGTFYQLGRFFDRIGRLPRIVTVENISISTMDMSKQDRTKTEGPTQLKASFKAVTFKYLTPQERPKKEPDQKGKGGAKKPAKKPAVEVKE